MKIISIIIIFLKFLSADIDFKYVSKVLTDNLDERLPLKYYHQNVESNFRKYAPHLIKAPINESAYLRQVNRHNKNLLFRVVTYRKFTSDTLNDFSYKMACKTKFNKKFLQKGYTIVFGYTNNRSEYYQTVIKSCKNKIKGNYSKGK